MPKIGNWIESQDMPCDRCGGKRRVAKTWTEKIKNDYGVMVLYHSEIVCTNKECQKAFETVARNEESKREKLRLERAANALKRSNIKITP